MCEYLLKFNAINPMLKLTWKRSHDVFTEKYFWVSGGFDNHAPAMMSLTRVRLPVRVFTFWSTSGSAARSTISESGQHRLRGGQCYDGGNIVAEKLQKNVITSICLSTTKIIICAVWDKNFAIYQLVHKNLSQVYQDWNLQPLQQTYMGMYMEHCQ
jgi:hypothetical protein